MTRTSLYWVVGPWPGKLALAARPRGGDWLADEISDWRREGIHTVLSLLTPGEESDLDISPEREYVEARGMRFLSYPIPDRQVPDSQRRFMAALEDLNAELAAGRNVVVHCRQGIGRTGLTAACLFITKGTTPDAALRQLTTARGIPVPETEEQRVWIDRFASSFAAAHQ